MKKQLGITITLALCLLSSTAAVADDAVIGALLGAGAGAVVGRSIGGRDGTIVGGALGAAAGAAIGAQDGNRRVEYSAAPVYYSPPAYYSAPAYYPPPQVYYTQPVRIEHRPVYFTQGGYERSYRYNGHNEHRGRDGNRNDHRRGWDDRYGDGRR